MIIFTNNAYPYNGTSINKELSFKEQANDLDKNRRKMNILVTKNNKEQNKKKPILSKDIICPECKQNILIEIKNFKIKLSGCKCNHNYNDILLYSFEESQKIDLCEIICEICNRNYKGNTHNNEFYICNTCNKNICPLCKSIHDKKHKIINNEDKSYICKKHNDSFIKYCNTCNENICILCENNHNGHEIFELGKILIDSDGLLKTKKELKNVINKFKWKVNIIKEIFNKMINLLDK